MDQYEINNLIKKIKELENALKINNKYGINWDKDNNKEEVVNHSFSHVPILRTVYDKRITNGQVNNLLIEGDNFHSLFALNFILKNSIDIIYIDPPYNTLHEAGDGGFKYNDKFVDSNDTYKHSKFLNFMNERLRLAYSLLKENGTIFISIDDHECADLKLLCDQIFGSNHFITMIPRITKPQRGGQETFMDISHDYILAYSKDIDFNHIIDREYDTNQVKSDSIGRYIPGDTKAILAALSQGYSKGGDYDFEFNGKIYKPMTKEGIRNRWLWTKDRMQAAADMGILVETKSTLRMQLYLDKKFEEKSNKMVPKDEKLIFHTTDFITNNEYSNPNGVADLSKIDSSFIQKFNNPKPVKLIKKLIQFCKNSDAVVLDFFAGSGTTGQAVLELNSEDGGNRKFILCTNNENNIFEEVTYPRLRTVITGKRTDGTTYSNGLKANLLCFKTDFVLNDINENQIKYNLVDRIDSLICILEDVFGLVSQSENYAYYSSNGKHLFIYKEFYNKNKFNEFKLKIMNTSGEKIVYVFSTYNYVDDLLFDDKTIIVKPIPSKIYEIYREIMERIKDR
jgi:adenine-specific DNA-methyltransferase